MEYKAMKTTIYALSLAATALFCASSIAAEAEKTKSPTPPYKVVELYAPAHFGNGYECMGQYEMRDMLRES